MDSRKMKIGILTLPFNSNYGGILQAYALQTALTRMGYDAWLINQSSLCKDTPYKLPFKLIYNSFRKYILREDVCVFKVRELNRRFKIKTQNTRAFIAKHIKSVSVDDVSQLSQGMFDAIVVGSDQIWRPQYYAKIENAFLDFAKTWKIRRIAYAASFGVDNWEYTPKQTKRCAALAKKFDAVSVREYSGIDLCRNYLGINAEQVLDPTLLLDKEDYIKLFSEADTPPSEGSLLYYVLDDTPERMELAEQIAREKGLKLFKINKAENNAEIQPPVEQWLRAFYDAELVITDSFHACIFSFLFQKPFVTYKNDKRGLNRIISLYKMLNINDRFVTNIDDLNKIDFSETCTDSNTIKKLRGKSYAFLENALKIQI